MAFPRAESAIAFSWLHPEAKKTINQVNPVILSKECFGIKYNKRQTCCLNRFNFSLLVSTWKVFRDKSSNNYMNVSENPVNSEKGVDFMLFFHCCYSTEVQGSVL